MLKVGRIWWLGRRGIHGLLTTYCIKFCNYYQTQQKYNLWFLLFFGTNCPISNMQNRNRKLFMYINECHSGELSGTAPDFKTSEVIPISNSIQILNIDFKSSIVYYLVFAQTKSLWQITSNWTTLTTVTKKGSNEISFHKTFIKLSSIFLSKGKSHFSQMWSPILITILWIINVYFVEQCRAWRSNS